MTLVLTEISYYGIVMCADSEVTCETRLPNGSKTWRVLNGVQKLVPIVHLDAGVSCWGYGKIGDIDTDIWLTDFIKRHIDDTKNLEQFASTLQDELRQVIGPRSDKSECGFHLAGYTRDKKGNLVPDFWHIHNGSNEYFKTIDPRQFNANHDLAGAIRQGRYRIGDQINTYITRNGDYQFYAAWSEEFEKVVNKFLREQGIDIPKTSLLGRVDYLRFQIRSISEIYSMSTLLPTIGGGISTLAIDSTGIQLSEMKA